MGNTHRIADALSAELARIESDKQLHLAHAKLASVKAALSLAEKQLEAAQVAAWTAWANVSTANALLKDERLPAL